MVTTCSAYGCTYRFKKGDNVRMFFFPRDPRLLARWLQAVRRKSWTPSRSSRICGKHFQTGKPSFDENHPDYVPNVFSFNAPKRSAHMYEKIMNRLKERRREREEIAAKGKPSFDENHPDYVSNVFNFNASKKRADMYVKMMNRLKERRVRGKNAVKVWRPKIRRCCVPYCHSSNKEEKISFHEIPSDNNLRLLWLKAISRQGPSKDSPWVPSQYSVVCQKHFKDDDYVQNNFIENKIRRLKPSAVPSLFLPESSINKIEAIYFKNETSLKMSDQQENRNMDYISCSVPGCHSKCHWKVEHNIAEENIPMFPMPRGDFLFNKWKEPLKGVKIEFTRDDHICERHFLEKDIERYDRTKTPDGNIIEIKKRLPTLMPNAVPIKFLKPPGFVRRKSTKKQLAFTNSVRNLTDKTSLTLNSCDSENSTIDSKYDSSDDLSVNSLEGQISQKKRCLPYSELIKNIQLVKKPSKSWSVVCTDEFTIFARWNNTFIAEKRLVIESSLTVRVFLKDWEVEMTNLVDLTTVDDVSLLLEKVESYSMDFNLLIVELDELF